MSDKEESKKEVSAQEEEEASITYGADFVPTCNLKCRFYEKEYPEADDLVMIKIINVEDVGAYVELLEYNNI